MKVKLTKCDFFKSEIHYLGHLLSQEGISPEMYVYAIKFMPPPQHIKELRQFLGLTGYYTYHTNHFANITHTLI